MPFVYREAEQLWHQPLAGSGSCVDIIKEYVPGLIGLPTMAWRAGVNVMEAGSAKVVKGTAIASFEDRTFMTPSDNALAFYVIER
ncbi:MAG TPA: BPSL0067 family protein [Duganella sp.]|uniref:BPSL0067 family protein n=1 Tax=Duganella sp. TaxID=1904440 RepID=UPI002ED1A381